MGSRIVRRSLLAVAVALCGSALAFAQPTTTLVSVAPSGASGNSESTGVAISADGRWVVFQSAASDLVASDTNNSYDIFVRDLATGTTTRASVGSGGTQANADSYGSAISDDGRWIVFHSAASTLVASDTNATSDVFVHDRQAGITTRVSLGVGGVQGNGPSYSRTISADGRWVGFSSEATNLVTGDTNGKSDVFVHDRQTGTTTRVSVGPGGAQGNGVSFIGPISADGRWVGFYSEATNLVADDTNGTGDVFVYDQQTGTTARVSVGQGGAEANGSSFPAAISADGRWLAFQSEATTLVPGDTNGKWDAFLHDRQTGTTTRISMGPGGAEGDGDSFPSAISASGRWVAFWSSATNLVPEDTNGKFDAFVYDQQTGATTRVSVGPGGLESDNHSYPSAMSADGRRVTFYSMASNLAPSDANGTWDSFVYDRIDPQCAVTLFPGSASAPAAGSTASVLVATPALCGWTAVSNDPAWLTITSGASGTGSGTVQYRAAVNAGAPRVGSISIWGQRLTVRQASATTPEAPEGLVVASVVGHVVSLRWTMPARGPAPTNFVLEGGLQPGEALAGVLTGMTPFFTFTAPSGAFYVRVHALNGSVRGAASNEIRLYVNVPERPSPPAHLLGLVHDSTLTLAWTNTFAGGAPTNVTLIVRGAPAGDLYFPLGLTDTFTFAPVPPGTYTFEVAATNAAAPSASSNAVALTFPTACSGVPQAPTNLLAYAVGRTLYARWDAPPSGAAPTDYVLSATGAYVGSVQTPLKALSGAVPPGTYVLSVAASNPCGQSAATTPYTVVVP